MNFARKTSARFFTFNVNFRFGVQYRVGFYNGGAMLWTRLLSREGENFMAR